MPSHWNSLSRSLPDSLMAFNSAQGNMAVNSRLTDCIRRLLQPTLAISLPDLLGRQIGFSDAAWNILSLSPQIHDWWARGSFAFFCRGITQRKSSSTVHVQFIWMTRKPARKTAHPKPERRIGDDDDELHDLIKWQSASSDAYDDSIASSFRQVLSGDSIDVKRTNEEAGKIKIMVDKQPHWDPPQDHSFYRLSTLTTPMSLPSRSARSRSKSPTKQNPNLVHSPFFYRYKRAIRNATLFLF